MKTKHFFMFVTFYRPQTKFAKVMFLQVSVCPHGGACMVAPGGCVWLLWGGMHGCSRGHVWLLWGGMHCCSPGGHAWFLGSMHGCSWGACMVAPGGACMVAPGGRVWDMMRYGDMINERAVRILLECILVSLMFFAFANGLLWFRMP